MRLGLDLGQNLAKVSLCPTTRPIRLFFLLWFAATSSFAAFDDLNPIFFDEGLSHLFGDANLIRSPDDRSVRLLLNRYTGSGFISSSMYQHGFFSALIKLPADHTAGIVVAFYASNGDVFVKNHDELDFEFLGNVDGKPWRFQTNMYGNGSTSRGREERYSLWFDPSKDFHRYSIMWNADRIIFWIDEVPIREIVRNEAMGSDYPQKPMSLYATIWDASSWATSGGRHKVDYRYAPFVSEFKDIVLEGCAIQPLQNPSLHSDCDLSDRRHRHLPSPGDYSTITPKRRTAMRWFRERFMYYSYCYDSLRYPEPPPECVLVQSEKDRFKNTGRLKLPGGHKPRHHRHRRRNRNPAVTGEGTDHERGSN